MLLSLGTQPDRLLVHYRLLALLNTSVNVINGCRLKISCTVRGVKIRNDILLILVACSNGSTADTSVVLEFMFLSKGLRLICNYNLCLLVDFLRCVFPHISNEVVT